MPVPYYSIILNNSFYKIHLGLVILIGMSQLLSVDLMSTRNQVAIGLALILGLMLPKLILDNPDLIKTGQCTENIFFLCGTSVNLRWMITQARIAIPYLSIWYITILFTLPTGSDDVDSVLNVFLSTGPFVGGLVGFLLDNILPGNQILPQ